MSFDLIGFLASILPALKQLAALTTTSMDDNVVAVVEQAIANPLIADWLHSLMMAKEIVGAYDLDEECPPELCAAVEASKIDWAKWIAAIPTILKIISLFAAK